MPADRYALIGPQVARIYPGDDLAHLMRAIAEAADVSTRLPGRHRVISVRGHAKQVLQVYEFGECVYLYQIDPEAN